MRVSTADDKVISFCSTFVSGPVDYVLARRALLARVRWSAGGEAAAIDARLLAWHCLADGRIDEMRCDMTAAVRCRVVK